MKWLRVLERHPNVFRALGGFLADGHAITIVHGNHDVELYWGKVQRGIRETLLAHAAQMGSSGTEAELDARVEFCPWFFYQQGVAYIEHGHQYDPLCATDTIMAPLSPLDPRRIARGFCEVFLRYVVRPTGAFASTATSTRASSTTCEWACVSGSEAASRSACDSSKRSSS